METIYDFQNVTIYRVGMFGVQRTDCRTLRIATGQKYAQYDDAIRYQLMEKGKRKPQAFVLAESQPWMRVVKTTPSTPSPDDPMVKNGDSSSVSRYTSYDMRYVTDFEDKLAASGAEVVFSVGAGHRGECGCGLCKGRMREVTA